MKNIDVQHTVEINEVEKELTFQFEYFPEERGSRDYYGQQMEPDSPGYMDFYCAIDEEAMEIDVLPRDIDAARELAWQQVADD
jgi:hypothetical protein